MPAANEAELTTPSGRMTGRCPKAAIVGRKTSNESWQHSRIYWSLSAFSYFTVSRTMIWLLPEGEITRAVGRLTSRAFPDSSTTLKSVPMNMRRDSLAGTVIR
jgi:hypothetical protein